MIARVAVWEPMPEDDRQWVIDAARTVPGCEMPTTCADEIGCHDLSRPVPKSETIYRVTRTS